METHFDNDHQKLASGAAARDALLARPGFTVVTSFPDAPNTVEVAYQDSVRGYLLSNCIDTSGTIVGSSTPR